MNDQSSIVVSQVAEGDSMNDYYSAHSGGYSKTDASRSGGVPDTGNGGSAKASKKKKDHSSKSNRR